MANRWEQVYKYDKKAKKWVVDDEKTQEAVKRNNASKKSGGKGSAVQKSGADVVDPIKTATTSTYTLSEKSTKPATTYDLNISSDLTDDDQLNSALNAQAAGKNIINKTNAITDWTKWLDENLYKRGGSNAIKNSPIYSDIGFAHSEQDLDRQWMEEGREYLNLSDEGFKTLMAENDKAAGITNSTWRKANARIGNDYVLDQATSKQEEEMLQGLYNLSGYDKTAAQMRTNVPDDFKREGINIYQDIANKQNSYSNTDHELDLENVNKYFGNKYIGSQLNGETLTPQERQEIEASFQRIQDYSGVDLRNMSYDEWDSGEWYDKAKAGYQADTNALDKIGYNKDYIEYGQAYENQAAMQEKQQQRMNEWESTTTAKSAQIRGNEDYGAVSAYRQDNSIGQLTPNADYLSGSKIFYDAEGNAVRPEDYRQAVIDSILNEYVAAGNDAEARAALEGYSGLIPELQNYNLEAIPYMSDEQKSNFFYLYNSGDKNGARAYLEALDYGLQAQRYQDMASRYTADMQANALNKALGSAASIPRNMMNNFAGAGVWLANTLDLDTYADMHEFNPLFDYTTKAQIARGETGQAIADATEGFELLGTNIPQAVYNAGMSAADSAANAYLFGRAGSATMGSGAYMSGLQQNLMAGDDRNKAHQDASAEGLVEIGTEYVSIDRLLSDVTNPVKYFIQNALVEGSEEGASTILNTIYDNLANGGESEVNQRINELMTQGYTREDAKQTAWIEWGKGLFGDVFTGVLSGGMGSGPRAAAIYASDAGQGRTISANETQQPILDIAKSVLGDNPEIMKMIEQQQAALDATKASASDITVPAAEADGQALMKMAEQDGVGAENAEALDAEAEETTPAKKAKKVKTPKMSNAQMGRIFREAITKLDENAQKVLSDSFKTEVVQQLKTKDYQGDIQAAADAVVKMATGDAAQLTPEIMQAAITDKAVLDLVNEYTAPIRQRNELIAMGAKGYQNPAKAIAEADKEAEEAPAESTIGGKTVKVTGLKSVGEDGTAMVEIVDADGNVREVDMEEVAFGAVDEGVAAMARMASNLGRNADTFLNNINEGQDQAEYAEAFETAMNFGRDGRNLDKTKSSEALTSVLTPEQIDIAYNLGRNTRQQNARMVRKNASGISVGNVDTSGINMTTLNRSQRASVHAVGRLAKAIGFNVRFVESKANALGKYTTENGSWDARTMTMTLDVHAGSNYASDTNYAMMHTAGHELTHYIKGFADSGLWNEYQEFVIGHLSEKMDEAALEARIQQHMQANPSLNRDGAIEEIIADASGDALMNISEAEIQQIAETNPSLFNKLKTFFEKWIGNLKKFIDAAYKGTQAKTAEAKAMHDVVDQLSEKWNKLLVNAAQNKNVASEATKADVQTVSKQETVAKAQSLTYAHIDVRTFDSVSNADMDLFCKEVEQAQIGFAAAAEILLADVNNSTSGQKFFTGAGEVTGQKRQTSELIARMKDETRWTWDDIRKSLQQFADMDDASKGYPMPKNTLTNRRMELYLDEMLTEGYKTLDGTNITQWGQYVEEKADYEGSKKAGMNYRSPANAIAFEDYAFADAGDVKYSVRNVDGKNVVWIEDDILLNKPADQKYTDFIGEYLTEHIGEVYTIIESGRKVYLGDDLPAEYTGSKYTKRIRNKGQEAFYTKNRAVSGIGEAIEIATNRRWEKTKHFHNKDAKYGIYKYTTNISFPSFDSSGKITGVNAYTADLLIRNASDGKKYLYDIQNIKNDAITADRLLKRESARRANSTTKPKGIISESSIAQNDENVKFSVRSSVESTKNLIAVHNLTEDKLNKALNLGGFPMPSIAITKTDIGHQNFGDISLVFGKETIDPQANKRNKVYSADAWTPTFPRIEYEVDKAVDTRVYNKLNALKSGMDDFFADDLRHILYGVEDALNRYGGEEGFIQRALDNYGLKAAYLEDIGQHAEVVTRQEAQRKEYSQKQIENYTAVGNLIGLDNLRSMPMSEIFSKYKDDIDRIWPGSTDSRMRFTRILQNTSEYFKQKDAPATYKTVTDAAETRKAVDDSIDSAAFERWVRDLYSGIEGASGVYNGKDLFTASGNRRSFASTHYPVSVENIARAMYDSHSGNMKNVSANYDAKTMRAVTSKTFKSIDEMHKNEGRLRARTQEEADALTNALDKRLNALIEDVLSSKPSRSQSIYDQLVAFDQAGAILQEIAIKRYSAKTIHDGFAKYGYSISDKTAQDLKDLMDEISEMPVNIFEAKPERAVYFDEVRYAIVPDDLSSDVLNALRAAVPDVRVYPAGDEAARLEMLNSEESVRFQQRDLSDLSDRELLVEALQTELSPEERDHIERYSKKVEELNRKQMQLEALNEEIIRLRAKANDFDSREELRKAEANAKTLRNSIANADKALSKVESAQMIREVIKRNRAEVRRKTAAQYKESYGKEKYRAWILEDAKRLYGWVVSPTNKGYVPEFLREPLAGFIESIDFTSARQLRGGDPTKNDAKFTDALEKLRRAIGEINKQQADIEGGATSFAGYIDLPADYMQEFDELVGKIKTTLDMSDNYTETPFARMKADQLHDLAKLFRILNSSISKVNRLVANGRYESAKTASNDTINDMNAMNAKVKTNKVLSTLNSMFNWKNTTPYYAFQRLGRGGKAIFEGLQDGWDKMARNSAQLIEYAENTFTSKQAKEWSKDIKTIKLDSGDSFQITASQAMSLYCLSKRQQAVGHLMGGGIRISDIDMGKGNTLSQVDNYVLSEADLRRIIGTLTAEQKTVADKLQNFMNTVCTDWGNEISMKRFGYKMFTEKFYFPIETDANNRSKIDDKQDGKTSLFRLLNMSAMKSLTPNANNAIIVRDIFDVFSNHASDIGKYNALALPILDFIKWYNYVEKVDVLDANGKATGKFTTKSTQKALERAYGQDAKQYVLSFIRDMNAEHDGGRNDTVLSKLMGHAKAGSVSANMRVAMLQITSLPRAAYAINPKYLLKGMAKVKSLNPATAIKGSEAQENIGILKWKNLGFYSTDVSRSTRSMVRRDEGVITKIRDLVMKPAEWGDNWTSNIIYEAAKAEMVDKHPNVKPGTKAYDAMLNKRVREIVYKTQVVDSTMTRSDFMRSKGLMTAFTAFMSEPTLTVNMLNESIQEAVMNARTGMNARDNLRSVGGKAVRAATVMAFTATASAFVEAIFDALRDDDDYEEFREKFADAFGGNIVDNVNVFAMLPILKDVISVMQGYENSSMVTQVVSQYKDVQEAITAWQEGKRPIYSVIYNMLKVAASVTGVGVQSATRDGVGLYNTFLADAFNTPKIQTYSDSKSKAAEEFYEALQAGDEEKVEWIMQRAEINGIALPDISDKIATLVKDEFIAGDITEEEAIRRLTEYGGKDENDAYWKIREWGYSGDGNFSKYTGLKDALKSGDRAAANAARKELAEHGASEQAISEQLSEIYNNGEATNILNLQMRSDSLYTSSLKLKADGEAHPDDFDAFITAIVNGGNISGEIESLMDKGYTVKQCMSAINGAFGKSRDTYRIMEKYNSTDAGILLDRILDAYEYLGLDRAEEIAWIDANWIM